MVAQLIAWLNTLVGLVFSLCFFYQFIYLIIAAVRGYTKPEPARRLHTYAFLICAHNEEKVIGQLIQSIKHQDYPADKIEVFCIADNCSDKTADCAREAGAQVYERFDTSKKGKSYVMDFGFRAIMRDYPDKFEGFFIFDADNILRPDYVTRMNEVFDQGFDVVTSYRNSKNFDSSWISAAYATWFLREAKFLNNARMLLRTGCAISGTGYLLSRKVVEEEQGWNYHLLTEDIQYSAICAIRGRRIAYAHLAEFFDEQPLTFKASWKQRMRWTKGFYQVFWYHGKGLLAACFKGKFAGFDLLMTIAPAMVLTILTALFNICALIASMLLPNYVGSELFRISLQSLGFTLGFMYLIFFALGFITTIFEYRRIHASKLRMFTNLFTFPVFMMSYIPIALVALVKRVDWVPTEHNISRTLDEITETR